MRTDERGLSLVEGLVAAALIAFAFIAVSNLFPTAYSNITYGGNQTLAANYALQKIEQLKNLPFNDIDAECLKENACKDLGNGFCRVCAVTPVGVGSLGGGGDDDDDDDDGGGGGASLAGDLKKVQVTVTWPDQYRPASLSVETMFTR